MLPLPNEKSDSALLADWVELNAILASDKNTSVSDLGRALRRESEPEAVRMDEPSMLASDAFLELGRRRERCPQAYPFSLDGQTLLRCRRDSGTHVAYTFCLGLSLLRSDDYSRSGLLFETLATIALQNYISGKAVRFGSPRTDLPKPFPDAVNHLSALLGEGVGYRHRQFPRTPKDDKLDVVGWKAPEDGRPSQIVVFGQCATGYNWRSKQNELYPQAFVETWFSDKVSPPLGALFVPFSLSDDQWEYERQRNALVFDRIRIARWCTDLSLPDHLDWVRERIKQKAD